MYKIILILMLSVFLVACSGDGKLKVINRTTHEIYFSINGGDYTIPGSTDPNKPLSISVNLDAGSDFINTSRKTYYLEIEGETFAIYDENQQANVPGTEITIKSNETTSVFCDPNYACLRINNNSSQDVKSAYYIKSYNGLQINIPEAEELRPDTSVYIRLEYSLEIAEEPEDIFYYTFQVILQDSTVFDFGDESTILHLDDLLNITIE